ncbi:MULTISPECIES: hypothetical protein [Prauserella salsuginis group]|uniref:Uncharacterized protein n=2 Tax=Prauserella salsuginis group TaxID=2893672 RepID=A0A839XWN6_9PSEU|nr:MULTISPECIES: hypothetical protein [Prauserella salsuginis group]MBB3664893.1 hypothetical protein [Prauserella sediminis]MCR3718362.1 hypothetical protein [Prauserella flava]MCR3732932.1 hypothetical protein [Prauserella salsuginis]
MPPTRYEFRVSGHMSESTRHAVGQLGPLEVVPAPPETIIYGVVTDDAHLQGIIGLLGNLGLRLVALQRVPEFSSGDTDPG